MQYKVHLNLTIFLTYSSLVKTLACILSNTKFNNTYL